MATGGEAKLKVQNGEVRVNGTIELRRGRQLQAGDRAEWQGIEMEVPPSA